MAVCPTRADQPFSQLPTTRLSGETAASQLLAKPPAERHQPAPLLPRWAMAVSPHPPHRQGERRQLAAAGLLARHRQAAPRQLPGHQHLRLRPTAALEAMVRQQEQPAAAAHLVNQAGPHRQRGLDHRRVRLLRRHIQLRRSRRLCQQRLVTHRVGQRLPRRRRCHPRPALLQFQMWWRRRLLRRPVRRRVRDCLRCRPRPARSRRLLRVLFRLRLQCLRFHRCLRSRPEARSRPHRCRRRRRHLHPYMLQRSPARHLALHLRRRRRPTQEAVPHPLRLRLRTCQRRRCRNRRANRTDRLIGAARPSFLFPVRTIR